MSPEKPIYWDVEPDLPPRQFIDLLKRSGLAARRPADQPDRIARMLANSSIIVSARDADGVLIGVSRCITDFAYVCYCSDLAVDKKWQGQGIGQALIERSRQEAGDGATFLLLSAPGIDAFYLRAGLEKFDNCFGMRRKG